MIRRELPLTTDASPAEPVANFRRGFSFVLAPAAAGSVLELDGVVHLLICLRFFLIWKVLLLPFRFSSCSLLLHAVCFCLNSDCPDETHQFASNRSHDLSLVLACCHQFHIALVQAILSFPGYLAISVICAGTPSCRLRNRAPIDGRWRWLQADSTTIRLRCALPDLVMLPRRMRWPLESSLGNTPL
jgi:hypothetical protein